MGQAAALLDVLTARDEAPGAVVQLGAAPLERRTRAWLSTLGADRHVVVDAQARWRDPGHQAAALWVSDERHALRALALEAERTGGEALARTRAWHAAVATSAAALRQSTRRALTATRALTAPRTGGTLLASGAAVVSASITAAAARGAALHLASSLPVRDACWHPGPWPTAPVFAQRGVAGIDGLASGLWGEALKLDRPVVALSGDLSALHDLSGLRLLAEHPPPAGVALVIIDNGGGGIFDLLPTRQSPAHATHFRTPPRADVADICRGLGLDTAVMDLRRGSTLADVLARLDETLAARRTRALVVRVQPDEQAVHAALRALTADVAERGDR
jgi:2-succinyl-5-enolpyruvyl-6-hydroxy-3-cyclohexene-1-carboxylate synthase